jgi:DNA replication protein DnaC
MTNKQLAANPFGCRTLTDPEVARLRERYEGLWSDPHKTCLTCMKEKTGNTTFRARENGKIVTFDCDCLEQWELHRWLLHSGIETRYQQYSWQDITGIKPAIQMAVMTYMEDMAAIRQGLGLTLWSTQKGTGKTLLGTLVAKGLMARGHDAHFTQFNEMIQDFTTGWRNEEERKWFIRRVRNVEFLVIDDMGRESKGRENITESMFDIVIRARVNACNPTIITTNYTPTELLQGYGGNVMSLLSEVNTSIEVSGRDYRPTNNARIVKDASDGITLPFVVS